MGDVKKSGVRGERRREVGRDDAISPYDRRGKEERAGKRERLMVEHDALLGEQEGGLIVYTGALPFSYV